MKTLIIILTAYQAAANALAKQLQLSVSGTDGGEFTFTVPVFLATYSTDVTPHGYWSAPVLSDAVYQQVLAALVQFPSSTVAQYDGDKDPAFPDLQLTSMGLRRAKSMITK